MIIMKYVYFLLGVALVNVCALEAGDEVRDIQLDVAIYGAMIRTLSPTGSGVFFIEVKNDDEYLKIEELLNLRFAGESSIARISDAIIEDGFVVGKISKKRGAMLKMDIVSRDIQSALIIGSWFSSSKSSQRIKYWFKKDEDGAWGVAHYEVLTSS